jgi:hypothetical protein
MHEICIFNNKCVRTVPQKVENANLTHGISALVFRRPTSHNTFGRVNIVNFFAHETKELKTHFSPRKCAKTHVRQSGV